MSFIDCLCLSVQVLQEELSHIVGGWPAAWGDSYAQPKSKLDFQQTVKPVLEKLFRAQQENYGKFEFIRFAFFNCVSLIHLSDRCICNFSLERFYPKFGFFFLSCLILQLLHSFTSFGNSAFFQKFYFHTEATAEMHDILGGVPVTLKNSGKCFAFIVRS
jgi:hypothetical protein